MENSLPLLLDDSQLINPPPNKKPKKGKGKLADTSARLSKEESDKLITLVRARKCIWSLADPSHKSRTIVTKAWKAISLEMLLPVDQCKKGWKSIRDSQRYHKKKQRKSGDSADETSQDEPIMITAEFDVLEKLQFLEDGLPERKTISTIQSNDLEVQSDADDNEELIEESASGFGSPNPWSPTSKVPEAKSSSSSKCNYSYATKPKNMQESDTKQLLNGITDLINIRKQESAAAKSNQEQEPLKYYSLYANLDRMLSKLPEEVVEELNMQFVNATYCELKKQKDEFMLIN